MRTFKEHRNEDGSSGFTIEKFREVFGQVMGGNITEEQEHQMTQLFMKIDANSDGTVDWDEFSTYMITVSGDHEEIADILNEKNRKLVGSPHKDMIVKIEFVAKERKYLTVSKDGIICLWTMSLKLHRSINTREFNPRQAWVQDCKFIPEHSKLVIVTDNRQLCIYDLFAIKPRLVAVINQLESNPLCVSAVANYDDDTDLILFGDDRGFVNVLYMHRRFLVDSAGDNSIYELSASKLLQKDSMEKYNICISRRQVHKDKEWVLKVQYFHEMNAFVSCSRHAGSSLVIGDLERKTNRYVNLPKGVACFDFSRRPSFLVTGGRDKVIRLWNPYVLSKPAGSLVGHNASISAIAINHEDAQIISLSEDKVIKIWNIRNLNCLQTLVDKVPHRPENIISAIFYDSLNRKIITGSTKLESWPMQQMSRNAFTRSHDGPVVAAMFNTNFHQVVSCSQSGTITLWDPTAGTKIFQFHRPHGSLEVSSLCFDKSGRRLITGSKDECVKMWNFNNGQILRNMHKGDANETTDVCFIEIGSNKFIVSVGWDRKITMFLDDANDLDVEPVRVLNTTVAGISGGHTDDISSVAFCPPNSLASASVDGSIIVWNLDSGYFKIYMKEPFLDLRSKEEKAVEKVMFVYNTDREVTSTSKIPLFSCHADGCVRVWDVNNGRMMNEYNLQTVQEEGMSTMSCDAECKILLVGGSKGHIYMFDLKKMLAEIHDPDKQGVFTISRTWRAHTASISSISYVKQYDIILSSAKDGCVRLWTANGDPIGTFGDQTWVLGDPSTYASIPLDLRFEHEEETKKTEEAAKELQSLKLSIIETWKGLLAHGKIDDDQDKQRAIKKMRSKAIQMLVAKKWKHVWSLRKNMDDWQLDPELTTVKKQVKFFSFEGGHHQRLAQQSSNSNYSSVYHMLQVHQVEDVQAVIATHQLKQTQQKKRSDK
ncbi:WD40-repeat-containing domain protein [Gorgonomyces haynaldii]|nr:WD40-repeat-containing domain protein [Gorgonomyces haynaldii]